MEQQAGERPGLPARRGRTVKGKTVVLALIALGAVVFGLVVYAVWEGKRNDPLMNAEPVGAGAGRTGMYNEYMGKERPKEPARP